MLELFTCDTMAHCDRPATRFEPRPDHWHDSTWCDECAASRVTVPIDAQNALAWDAFTAQCDALAEHDARYPDVDALLGNL